MSHRTLEFGATPAAPGLAAPGLSALGLAALGLLALTVLWPALGDAHVNPWPEPQPRHSVPAADAALTLRPCRHGSAYCGYLERPLDPLRHVPGSIAIYVEFYPHSAPGKAVGTLVATEGGPGYPATESRDDYLALFRPLMSQRDVVIMDNRGTGRSGAIDCHALQTAERWTVEGVAACGESLGSKAALYGTAYAADDLAAILNALHVNKVNLYGDSYGTYFEQVFVTRHPELVQNVVLDGAYPLTGPDYAWYPTYAPAMRDKFNVSCARSAACAALPGSSLDHIRPALESLRQARFAATGTDVDGVERHFEAGPSALATVMFSAAPAAITTAETDAASRAFAAGDRLPLLRLMAETAAAVDSRDASANPRAWSAGLAAAVMCGDPPQIFDMQLSPDARRADRDRVLDARRRDHPDTYAPFTIDEYRGMPLDYSFLDECVGWPVAPADHRAGMSSANAVYPDVPALVISGELDDITTPADGAAVAAAFPHGVQVRIANSFHVNALPRARSNCAARIVRQFLATSATGPTACAATVPPLRLVSQFATHCAEVSPATPLPGTSADPAALRIAAAAVATAGDVLARAKVNSSGHGVGLRGGTFRITEKGDVMQVTLNGVRWAADLAVSGSMQRSAGRNGRVRAEFTLEDAPDPGRSIGHVRLSWRDGTDPTRVEIEGQVGKTVLRARGVNPGR
jgi:pimeloyl-ACP methyl ester carboxylesterase